MKVHRLMRLKPRTVTIDVSLDVVWDLIAQEQIHMVPVVDDEGRIKGIITAEDLFIKLIPDYQEFFSDFYPTVPTIEDIEDKLEDHFNLTIEDVMNTTVHTVYQDHDVFKAVSKMMVHSVRILPVVDKEEKLVGFIVEKDIFKHLFEKQKHIAEKIKKKKEREAKIKDKEKKRQALLGIAKKLKEKGSKYIKYLDTKRKK